MDNIKRELGVDEASLIKLLNFIYENIKEDRKLALEHHDNVSKVLNGGINADDNGVAFTLILSDATEALKRFLDSSSKSIDQALKMAKIIADMSLKTKQGTLDLSDDTRILIEEQAKRLDEERKNNDKIAGVIGGS